MHVRLRVLLATFAAAGLIVPLMGVAGAQAAPKAATSAPCMVKTAPTNFVETGLGSTTSSVAFVVTVECQPKYAESAVELFAPELNNNCHDTLSWAEPPYGPSGWGESFDIYLDNDGNGTAVVWGGPSCRPSTNVIEASLLTPPGYTATTTAKITAPHNTPVALRAFPPTYVEDSTYSAVAAIFYVEYPATYSEQWIEISDAQLFDHCGGLLTWYGPEEQVLSTNTKSVEVQLDNNGNAWAVAIGGPSCSAGATFAEASPVSVSGNTLTTTFTVQSPHPTQT